MFREYTRLPETVDEDGYPTEDLEMLRNTKLGEAKAIEKECRRHGITVLPYTDGKYPQKLKVIAAPPVLLYLYAVPSTKPASAL